MKSHHRRSNWKHNRRLTVERRLRVEFLEGRVVLSASLGIDPATGVLGIQGSDGNDVAEVRQTGRRVVVTLNSAEGTLTKNVSAAAVKTIVFRGLSGDDSFTNLTGIRSDADGGHGHDVLRGGSSGDRLVGGDNADEIYGGSGDDRLEGGVGDDSISAGPGRDWVHGRSGSDRVRGEGGDDTLHGGLGDDRLEGGAGGDREYGSEGDDDLYGGLGDDYLSGGEGRDDEYGESGRDSLDGDEGDDRLDGGSDDDLIRGGGGLDREDDTDDTFDDGDEDGDGYDDDHDRPVDPVLVTPLVFSDAGTAELSGTSASERDKRYYTFTAVSDQTLAVVVHPDANGRYAEVEVSDTTSRREVLELEPSENGRTTGQVAVISGHTYLLRICSPSSRYEVSFAVSLSLDGSTITPPVIGTPIVFDAAGKARLVGVSRNEDDARYYSFTAATDGSLSVNVLPDAAGRYVELEVEDVTTGRELLELEPGERRGRTSGSIAVVAGRTYVFEVKSSYDQLEAGFTIDLALS